MHGPAGDPQLALFAALGTHLPLAQSVSATQRHAVCAPLSTGAGLRLVVHVDPEPELWHATELGGGWHPWPSSVPVPVQPEQLPLWLLGMQWPLSHTASLVQ